MTFTPDERIAYWKQRILTDLVSAMKQMQINFGNMRSNIAHIELDRTDIDKAFSAIDKGISELGIAISNAKVVTKEELLKQAAKDNNKLPKEEHETDTKAGTDAPVDGK